MKRRPSKNRTRTTQLQFACAFNHIKERKTLYILTDDIFLLLQNCIHHIHVNKAHLLDMQVLRKLRLLFERFSKKNNLVLYGQRDKVNAEGRESTLGYLLHYLSLNVNKDIKSRITDSANIKRQNDEDIERYIVKELESVRMGINVFNEGAN